MSRRLILLALATFWASSSLCAVSLASEPAKTAKSGQRKQAKFPTWQQIEKAANETMRKRSDYAPGDILSRSEAQAFFARAAELGWQPADAAQLAELVPADDEFIVKHLRGKNNKDGQRFMRHVAKYPDGYDRLDRMVRLPRGKVFTEDLIHNPGGWQMVEYMATAQGGVEMGKMLSEIPRGKDFNEPTGRIYTAEALIGEVKRRYDAATTGRGGSSR